MQGPPRPPDMANAITVANRTFVALRKVGRPGPGRSPVYHAVTPHCRIALCATEPGTRSQWAEPPAADVTCAACLIRLSRLQQHQQNVGAADMATLARKFSSTTPAELTDSGGMTGVPDGQGVRATAGTA